MRDLELVACTSSGLNGLAFADVSVKLESLPKFGLCIAFFWYFWFSLMKFSDSLKKMIGQECIDPL